MPKVGKVYTVSDLTSTLNISRTTLLYYEQLGIVRPERNEESGYRTYHSRDIFRLMSAILLKNVGIEPKHLADRLDSEPFSDEHFDEYLELTRHAIAYHEAQLDCLQKLNRLRHAVGTIGVVDVEPYYISYDRAEGGYHDFPDDEALVSLLANMPIGGLGSHDREALLGDIPGRVGSAHWGRTVAVRHAPLIEGLPQGLAIIGGCRCVCSVTFQEDIVDPGPDIVQDRRRIQAFLDEHELRATEPAFCPYSLPSDSGFYVPSCVPVEPIGGTWSDVRWRNLPVANGMDGALGCAGDYALGRPAERGRVATGADGVGGAGGAGAAGTAGAGGGASRDAGPGDHPRANASSSGAALKTPAPRRGLLAHLFGRHPR